MLQRLARFILAVFLLTASLAGCGDSGGSVPAPELKKISATYFAIVDGNYDLAMQVKHQIPWQKLNRINIAFATLDSSGLLTNLAINGSTEEADRRIRNIIALCRKANPKAEIFIVSNYGGDMDDRYREAAAHPQQFADSVLAYLKNYGLDGYDMDWETIFINDYSAELNTLLSTTYKTLKAAGTSPAGGSYKLTYSVWPGVHRPEHLADLEDSVDQLNLMTYGTGAKYDMVAHAESYFKAGFPYEKMIGGAESEVGYTDNVAPDDQASISKKAAFVKQHAMAGLFSWRLDNDMCSAQGTGPPTFQVADWIYYYLTEPDGN